MKSTIIAICILITGCDSGYKEMCSYQKDNYQYAKETHGVKSREAEAARIKVLDCASRRMSSQMRRMQ